MLLRSPSRRSFCFLFFTGFFTVALGCNTAESANVDVDATLEQMAKQGKQFDASALHKAGTEGLDAVLDRLLWQLPEGDGAAGQLIDHLEAHLSDVKQYVDGYAKYIGEVEDDARLTLLGNRVRRSLEDHKLGRVNERMAILKSSIAALVRSKNDKYSNLLTPLLDHENEEVSKYVVGRVANLSSPKYFPQLHLDALKSKRESVVLKAIECAPTIWDDAKKNDVKAALITLFEGESDKIKGKAAFPLLHDYDYPPAIDFLIEQASGDGDLAQSALSWLSDQSNFRNREAAGEAWQRLADSKNKDVAKKARKLLEEAKQ